MNLDYSHLHEHENMGFPEAEDTAFHADLTRRILMLIDDEDETNFGSEFKRGSVVSRGCYSGGLVMSGGYFNYLESGRNVEVPGWMERLWATNGAGTGVFIPRAVAAAAKSRRRRRNKPRKSYTANSGGIRIHG